MADPANDPELDDPIDFEVELPPPAEEDYGSDDDTMTVLCSVVELDMVGAHGRPHARLLRAHACVSGGTPCHENLETPPAQGIPVCVA